MKQLFMNRYFLLIKKNIIELAIIIFSLSFSSWLMFSTFSYNDGSMLISTKAWSDFASHIPLIRSFSLGSNFPPEYPIFSGVPIHYHFVFYALVGLIEKIGVRIDYALNIPSILGFSLLLFTIYYFAQKIFKSKSIGILSVLFFLFNGSFSFVYFLADHSLNPDLFWQIISNTKFPSFAPYGEGVVSAFWNLNIYTNQRHLALSYALSLILISIFISPILKKRKINYKLSTILGAILGLSYFLHMAVFMMTIILVFFIGLIFKKLKFSAFLILIFAFIFAFPQYLWQQSNNIDVSPFKVIFKPGYLLPANFTTIDFIFYWFMNLGLNFILIPVAFIFLPKNLKKILLAFIALFIIGNIFQFSIEIAANHKFFNYFIIAGNMFSAYLLVLLWKKNFLLKFFVSIMFFLLIFSGIIDFFPIYNDAKIRLDDYSKNKDANWIIKNTPPDSIILNNNFLFNSASIAGRKIFLGWPYFSWSAGYNTQKRSDEMKNIFSEQDKNNVCKYLRKNGINFIYLSGNSNDFQINTSFFDNNFKKVYKNQLSDTIIYDTKKSCQST